MYRHFLNVYNPQILESSKEKKPYWEGCISNEENICLVTRPVSVKVRYQNSLGKTIDMQANGLMARIFQHEIDHLNGLTMEEFAEDHYPIKKLEDKETLEAFLQENLDKTL
jgi:peptide deformylase